MIEAIASVEELYIKKRAVTAMKIVKIDDPQGFYTPGGHYYCTSKRIVEGATQFGAVYGVFEPGGYADPHSHPGVESAYYILSGRALMRIDNEEQEIQGGTAVFIPPGSTHGIRNIGSEKLIWITFSGPRAPPQPSTTVSA